MSARDIRPENKELWPIGWFAALGLCLFAWWRFHAEISMAVMWIRYYEGQLLWFDPEGKQILARWLSKTTADSAKFGELFRSGGVVGYTLRWPALLIVVSIFALLIWKSPARTARYSNKFSMKELASAEADLYPTIKPAIAMDMISIPLDDPINGMRQDGRMYCRRNQLVLPAWTDIKSVPDEARALDDGRYLLADRASSVLAKQLGKPWRGINELAAYERSLFAAFVAQLNHDGETSLKIINGLANAWKDAYEKKDPSLLTTPEVDEVLATHGDSEELRKLVGAHYHVRCVLMRVLAECRKNGALPPGWFRWLKMADRVTWYALNDMGLDVASVEACGIRSHYQAEKMARQAIDQPMVAPAIDGLIDYLNTYADEEGT
ncbi:hypothetical protein LMG667_03310 [Xanthomonas euvesicatoria]|uniref:secretion/conjugation apparatus DotM-related subunit n=1 Tax=Xanthomonas euvesicatoria TaxID=456327 RepID=UPI00080D8DB4|nr:hypothetical protein [Xanthomonas euvesicatoria]OCG90016.1 hypothetical protein LMG667_03310 [Xanthomonas euvesicatoria]